MTFTAADLSSINAAITSGELSVEVQGRKVLYRSIDDLLKARHMVESELAAQRPGGRLRTGYFTFTTYRERH